VRGAARILRAPRPWARRAAGPPPAAPRRMPAPPLLRPPRGASVPTPAPLPSQPRPRGRRRRRLRELRKEGGARFSGRHAADVGPGRSGEEGAAKPPRLGLPGARAGERAPRPRRWEGAIGKRQRGPAERPPRDRRRRRVFPAPPRGRERRASAGCGAVGTRPGAGRQRGPRPARGRSRGGSWAPGLPLGFACV
jgi:hypothetical protein